MLNFGGVDVFSHELVQKTWAWILHLRQGQKKLIQSGPKSTSYKQGSITALISGWKKNSYPYTRPVIGVPCPSMLSGPYCFSFELLFVMPPGVFFGSEVSAKFFFYGKMNDFENLPQFDHGIFLGRIMSFKGKNPIHQHPEVSTILFLG